MKNTFTPADKIGAQLTDTTDDYKVKYGDITYISDDVVKAYFYHKYGDFYCTDLHTKFVVFQGIHTRDFARAFEAWSTVYDPISNYNSTEERAVIDSHGTETDTRATDPTHNTVTTSAIDGTKSETFTTTDTSATPRLDTRETNTGGTVTTDDLKTTNTKSRENTSITTQSGFTLTGHDVHGETITKSGNIGVTTTQEMINAECEMRLNPVQKNFLDLFIYEYACYVGGSWS